MINKSILIYLLSVGCSPSFPPQHLHAYQITHAGANTWVDPNLAKYATCDIDIVLNEKQWIIDHQSFNVERTEKVSDSMMTYFCYQLGCPTLTFVSITIVPIEMTDRWYVMMVWEDSTRAYKTQEVKTTK